MRQPRRPRCGAADYGVAVRFDKDEHDRFCPDHSGIKGHYCYSWDMLYICLDCHEIHGCECTFADDDKHLSRQQQGGGENK